MQLNCSSLSRTQLMILGSALGAIFTTIAFVPWSLRSVDEFMINYFWSFVIWIAEWYGCMTIVLYMDQRLSWEEAPKKKFVIYLVSLVLYSTFTLYAIQLFMLKIGFGLDWAVAIRNLRASRGLLFSIFASLFTVLTYTVIDFFRFWQGSKLEAERLRTEMMTYKYESLKGQLNPHFLFNTLASVNSLIDLDPSLAKRYVNELSAMFRYVLEVQERDTVSLVQELDFGRKFARITESRAEGGLIYYFEPFETSEDEHILPLSIQLLLENVAKHNAHSGEAPITTTISREGDFVQVRNNRSPKRVLNTTKIGLQNLKMHYAHYTARLVELHDEKDYFTVRLPIIKVES